MTTFYRLSAALARGWVLRQSAEPERSNERILLDALTDVLTAAMEETDDVPCLDAEILATLERIETMSNSHYDALTAAVAKLGADVAQFKLDLVSGLAALKAQVAAGATPDFAEVDAATSAIGVISSGVADASAALHAVSGISAVVFNAADTTPNSPGGRNSSHLSGFDPSVPETA